MFHTFVLGVYFFPLLGGWLADRFLGKYNTVLWLSLVYCAGHACLALFADDRTGFYAGLGLIALGSGGIKPCVASFVGDQFDQSTKHLARSSSMLSTAYEHPGAGFKGCMVVRRLWVAGWASVPDCK